MSEAPKITIEFCTLNTIGKVQTFLHNQWAENHILAIDHQLMNWQHNDLAQNRYSFVVARVQGEDNLCGILGFISTRQYDPALADQNTLWLTTWMVRPDMRKSALGLKLLRFLSDNEPATAIGTVGNNEEVAGVYTALGYKTGTLNRHAVINKTLNSYKLISGTPAPTAPHTTDTAFLKPLKNEDLASSEVAKLIMETTPLKTPTYLANRYLNHPTYDYDILGLIKTDSPQAIAITRVCRAENATALRVVDYFGPDSSLTSLSQALNTRINEQHHEYADLYSYGLADDGLKHTSFQPVPADGGLVLPNYFEPFDLQNTVIRFAFKTEASTFRLFKADADQDRPNQLAKKASAISVPQSA